jgi:hypothetical protein
MYSSQSQPLNDQYRQSDVVPLWPTAEEARDLDAGHGVSNRYTGIAPHESDYSGLRAEQSSHASFHPSDFKSGPAARPSLGRRISRTLGRFFIAVLIGVGSTLAWQSHGDDAKEMVRTWAPSLGWLVSASPPKSALDGQVFAAAAVTSPELVQQLEPMARNIAIVLFNLEQLAAKQEQMAQNIAGLQAVEQDRQKMSSPPPSRAAPVPPRRPPQPATQSPAVQPSSVYAAPSSGRSPLPLR